MAGWCRINFRGPSGYGSYIRYAELLVPPLLSTKYEIHRFYLLQYSSLLQSFYSQYLYRQSL